MTIIQLTNIHKQYHHQPILQGVNFAAEKGDVIALMGSSGSGKSTLLRCINLLTLPDAGTLKFAQHQVDFPRSKALQQSFLTAWRRRIGMVFQQYNLWAHMNVLNNLIAAPCYVLGLPKTQAIEQAMAYLAKVGLQAQAERYPAQLSGGQQQRAAIARALMMQPEILLFDEPTSALDPEMVGEVLQVMQQLAQEGMTMVVATHELQFAQRVSNQSIFLHQGKIIEAGSSATMFAQPQTERFQQFLTAMRG